MLVIIRCTDVLDIRMHGDFELYGLPCLLARGRRARILGVVPRNDRPNDVVFRTERIEGNRE